jgi:hypothetical protein
VQYTKSLPKGVPTVHVATKTKRAVVKLTPEQYRAIEQRAARCGVRMTAWMRSVLLQAAAGKRIREPSGALI